MKSIKKVMVLFLSLALLIPCISMTAFAAGNEAIAFFVDNGDTSTIQPVSTELVKSTTPTEVSSSQYWGYSYDRYSGTFYSLNNVFGELGISLNSLHGLNFLDIHANGKSNKISGYEFYIFDQSEVFQGTTALGAADTYGLLIRQTGYTSVTVIKDISRISYYTDHMINHNPSGYSGSHTCIICGEEEHYIRSPYMYDKIYDCQYKKNSWYKDQYDYWYYIKADGSFASGWLLLGNTWYYLDPYDNQMMVGPAEIDGSYYVFKSSGAMAANGWAQYNGNWYYASGSGRLYTGWQYIGGKWYYLDPYSYGAMWTEFFHDYNTDKWYYMNPSSGAMVYGWVWDKYNSCWYYMGSSGAAVTGWHVIGGKWYFFLPNTRMAQNEWYDGYWLNADGSWTYPYRGSWHVNSYGWWFGDTSGWYARNTKMKINDYYYTFDGNGYEW